MNKKNRISFLVVSTALALVGTENLAASSLPPVEPLPLPKNDPFEIDEDQMIFLQFDVGSDNAEFISENVAKMKIDEFGRIMVTPAEARKIIEEHFSTLNPNEVVKIATCFPDMPLIYIADFMVTCTDLSQKDIVTILTVSNKLHIVPFTFVKWYKQYPDVDWNWCAAIADEFRIDVREIVEAKVKYPNINVRLVAELTGRLSENRKNYGGNFSGIASIWGENFQKFTKDYTIKDFVYLAESAKSFRVSTLAFIAFKLNGTGIGLEKMDELVRMYPEANSSSIYTILTRAKGFDLKKIEEVFKDSEKLSKTELIAKYLPNNK